MKIAINGFGRIGRTILRQVLTGAQPDVEVVAVNDIAGAEMCAYLFGYDSTFGPFPGPVRAADGRLHAAGQAIPLTHHADLRAVDLRGVDVVLECTGRANTPQIAAAGLDAGAGAVLISGPSAAAERTIVLGANEGELGAARIVSNASCTTNALAPLLALLHRHRGIVSAHSTTIHCYTASQPMVDTPRADMARSRAGALSMVPTTTSATGLVDAVLPELAGRVTGAAVRVPTASVSAIDLTVTLAAETDVAAVNAALVAADDRLIGTTTLPLVSSDLRGRPESVIMALPETLSIAPRQVRLFGWYDNEWGFSARMCDMARRMAAR